jgi:hypothetical protein
MRVLEAGVFILSSSHVFDPCLLFSQSLVKRIRKRFLPHHQKLVKVRHFQGISVGPVSGTVRDLSPRPAWHLPWKGSFQPDESALFP